MLVIGLVVVLVQFATCNIVYGCIDRTELTSISTTSTHIHDSEDKYTIVCLKEFWYMYKTSDNTLTRTYSIYYNSDPTNQFQFNVNVESYTLLALTPTIAIL